VSADVRRGKGGRLKNWPKHTKICTVSVSLDVLAVNAKNISKNCKELQFKICIYSTPTTEVHTKTVKLNLKKSCFKSLNIKHDQLNWRSAEDGAKLVPREAFSSTPKYISPGSAPLHVQTL
jgi:hypothetical protein